MPQNGYKPWSLRLLRHLWMFKTTREGKLVIASTLIAGSVAGTSLAIPAYMLFCGLCGLAGVAWVAGWLIRPSVTAEVTFPGKMVADEPAIVAFRLENASRRRAFDLSAGFLKLRPTDRLRVSRSGQPIPVLKPGERDRVEVSLQAPRRGVYPLPDWQIFTTYPLYLFRNAARVRQMTVTPPVTNLLVAPRFHALEAVALSVRERYQPGGVALSSNIGAAMEYAGNREYQPGDSLRFLDHRAWGRMARPVVREFLEEYYCRVGLLLDTFVADRRRPGPKGYPHFEAAVSVTAALAEFFDRSEYILDIFAAGPHVHVYRTGRHTAAVEHIFEVLASIEHCRLHPAESVAPELFDELRSISALVCVFLDWDDEREWLVRHTLEQGCDVKVLVVREGDTAKPMPDEHEGLSVIQTSPQAVFNGEVTAL